MFCCQSQFLIRCNTPNCHFRSVIVVFPEPCSSSGPSMIDKFKLMLNQPFMADSSVVSFDANCRHGSRVCSWPPTYTCGARIGCVLNPTGSASAKNRVSPILEWPAPPHAHRLARYSRTKSPDFLNCWECRR